jgi:outer membrane protein TolC
MRRLLPALFLASAALLGAEPAVPARLPAVTVVSDRVLPLAEAIDRALTHNLGLAVTRLDAASAHDAVLGADAAFDSVFGWSNTLRRGEDPVSRLGGLPAAGGHDSDVSLTRKFTWGGRLTLGAGMTRNWNEVGQAGQPSRYDFGTSLSYTQPLLAGAWESVNLSALIAAKQGALRGRLALRSAALDLIRDTEVAYWSLAGARTLVSLRESSLRSAESLLAQVVAKRALGDATRLEELQAEAEVASQRVAVLNARQAVDGAEMGLRRLLGRGSVEEVQAVLAVQPLDPRPAPAPAPFGPWIRTVAAFDFATAIQLSQLAQAESALDQARQNDQPQLDLTVAGSNYSNPFPGFGGGYDNFRDRSGWNNSVGLALRIPLGGRETAANLRVAARARRQAELRLADVRQTLVFTARAAWRDLEASGARAGAATSSLELQRQAYEGERARYDAGQSDLLRVLQAQAALDTAQLNWIQASLDARVAAARTARLDGSILPAHGYVMDVVEAKVGAGAGLDDTLPPLPETP